MTSEETEECRETQEVVGRKGGKAVSENDAPTFPRLLTPNFTLLFSPFAIKKPEVNAHSILPLVTHSASH